jgi:hypothetical protein
MWKVQRINNELHTVTMRDTTDNEELDLLVPEQHRFPSQKKLEWVKTQTDARDVLKKKLNLGKKIAPYAAMAVILIEAVVIVLLMLRH